MGKIFISYSSVDKRQANRVAKILDELNIGYFLDQNDIAWSEAIKAKIKEGIAECETVLFVVSPASLKSQWVTYEVAQAEILGKQILPYLTHPSLELPSYLLNYHCKTKLSEVKEYFKTKFTAHSAHSNPDITGPSLAHYHEDYEQSPMFSLPIQEYMAKFNVQVERLIQEQYRVIQQLRGHPYVRISGCAGSGKTLIAAEKAIRLAKAGVTTLFLCHSPLLAQHVKKLTEGSGVRVESFGELIADHTRNFNPVMSFWTNYEEPTEDQIYDALTAIINKGPVFQAIIIDEGQDFRSQWWTIVEALLEDPIRSILYIFYDSYQALLPDRSSSPVNYPIEAPVVDLSRNCRNSGKIFELIQHIHPETPQIESELKECGKTFIILYERGNEQEAIINAILLLKWFSVFYGRAAVPPFK